MVEVNGDDGVKSGRAKQSNKYYHMFERADGTFDVEFGRVDSTSQKKSYPISKWDSTYKEKTKKGYKDVTHLFVDDGGTEETGSNDVAVIANKQIQTLFTSLQQYASNSIKANYNVSSAKVTQIMVDEAQTCLDQLVTLVKELKPVDEINKKLLDLYHIIPRKMGNVNDFLIPTTQGDLTSAPLHELANKLIGNEQNTLDVMAGQVVINAQNQPTAVKTESKTILDILGIQVVAANDDDIATIKKLMGPNAHQFKKAYAVVNNNTQLKFDKHLDTMVDKKRELFWHGSRNQNWLNIISTGLLIRPAGAIHSGSMFGDGIYFADKAQKSIGYTSLRGSYWSKGGDDTAYLALFSVHVGKQKNIKHHDSSCYRLSKSVLEREGFDSVFAHGGADLRNNEYIVYDSHKSTISFLIEIGG